MPIPAGSSALVSPDDLADYLKRPPFAVGSDEERQALQALEIASAAVRSATGRRWEAGTFIVYLPTTDGEWLTLPAGATVTSVSLDGVAVTDYSAIGARLYRYGGWLSRTSAPPVVTVTYTDDGAVPEDVRGAVLAVAADLFENPRGLTSETIDDYTWRASDSERGGYAAAAVAAVRVAYRRRVLTVPLR